MNPEFPRFIARRRNNAALIRTSADNHRLATKLRPFQQFHGYEERVHIHVKNGRRCFRRSLIERTVLSSKSREIRHGPSLLSPQACNNSDLVVSAELEWI